MAILDWLKNLRRTSPDLDTSRDRGPWFGQRVAGIHVTPDEALRLATVWACVTVISKALASCKWDVFFEMNNGDRQMRRSTATYGLLNTRPNPEMTAFAWREAMVIQALIYGNAISEIERDMSGTPVGLWPIEPTRWRTDRDGDGNLVVLITNFEREDIVLSYKDVYHLHGPGVDGIAGFDTVAMAARSMGHAMAMERFGQSFYGNNMQFGGVLSSKVPMSQEAWNRNQENLADKHKGPDKAWRILMTDQMDFTQLSVNPNAAQFIESRQHEVEEVCRWFGVPPHKVQHLLRSTFNNIEHQGLEFVRDALVPWAERMAQEADFKLVQTMNRGFKTRLDLDFLAEGDAKSKAETDSILVQNGILSRNEARKRRGFNTIGPEGEKYTAQVNLTTLEKIGEDKEPQQMPFDSPAEALFSSAALRWMKRQRNRAKNAARRAKDFEDFRRQILMYQPEHAAYAGNLIVDVVKTLEMQMDSQAMKNAILPFVEEEAGMIIEAHERGDVADWCDMNARAKEIGGKLAAVICEVQNAITYTAAE